MDTITFGIDQNTQSKKKKKKQSAPTSFVINDEEGNFQNNAKDQISSTKRTKTNQSVLDYLQSSANFDGSNSYMPQPISINPDLFKTADDDDIKPVLVTNIPHEQLQEILKIQEEGAVNKVKNKEKEAKKKTQERKAQWVQIDNQGNKVKAFVETDADKIERKRKERKDLKKEIKKKFLEEQEKKKLRK